MHQCSCILFIYYSQLAYLKKTHLVSFVSLDSRPNQWNSFDELYSSNNCETTEFSNSHLAYVPHKTFINVMRCLSANLMITLWSYLFNTKRT